jgi:hypothetical protein
MKPPPSGTWRRRDEPPWHDPSTLIILATNIGATNLTQIQAAFSTGSRAPSDLPVYRNYFAHRNRGSLDAARSLIRLNGVAAGGSMAEVLARKPVGRSNPLLEEWISDLEFIAEFVCE